MHRLGACLLATCSLISWACGGNSPTSPSLGSCATSALRGAYGSQRNGQTGPGSLLTSVGIATFDGAGHIVEEQSVSTNGSFSSVTNQGGGYTIGQDCSGTETDEPGNSIANLVMVQGGDEVLGISVVPGSNVAVHFERIEGSCSNATLNGVYGFQRNGQVGPGAPLLALGTITFDGNGNSTAQQTTDRSGTIGPANSLVGTYAIRADCTGTQMDTTGTIFGQIVIVHGGAEVLGMSMTAGNNVVIHYEKVK